MSSTKKKIKTKDGKEIEQEFLKFDPKEMITIVSNDGMEFVVDKRCAMISGTIKNMLTTEMKEQKEKRIEFENFEGEILEKVIQYFYYKMRYDHDPDNRPEFIIEPPIALQLMMAAHYLEA